MPGPTLRRRQLGAELQRLRETAQVSRGEAAAAIGCSLARIGHIETGRNTVTKAELIVLCQRYRATDRLAVLEEIRLEASRKGWWSVFGLPESMVGYIGLETDATAVRTVELETIPGLLQTEEYARALYLELGQLSTKEINRRVAARMQRQARLSGSDPLQLTAIISQGALERCANAGDVGTPQLARLADRAQWPNITLRIVPFSVGLHVGMPGPFSVLSFPEQLSDIAYYEYSVGGHLVDDEAVVSQLVKLLGKVTDRALDSGESLKMISNLAQRM